MGVALFSPTTMPVGAARTRRAGALGRGSAAKVAATKTKVDSNTTTAALVIDGMGALYPGVSKWHGLRARVLVTSHGLVARATLSLMPRDYKPPKNCV